MTPPIPVHEHNVLMDELGLTELKVIICDSCNDTGRIQLEPDSIIYHPCDTCQPEKNEAWQDGFKAGNTVAPVHDRSRDPDGNPRVLWISKEAIALTLEDCKEGEGVMYVLPEVPAVDAGALDYLYDRALIRLEQLETEMNAIGHASPMAFNEIRNYVNAARAHLESVRGK